MILSEFIEKHQNDFVTARLNDVHACPGLEFILSALMTSLQWVDLPC